MYSPRVSLNALWLALPFVIVIAVSLAAEWQVSRHDDELPRGTLPKGRDVARLVLARHSVGDVKVSAGDEDLYAPLTRTIELDTDRIDRVSTAAAAVAAHEAAHAVQHARRWPPFMTRLVLAVPATLASLAWLPLAIAGEVLDLDALVIAGFALFGFAILVGLLTLVLELDASRQALEELRAFELPAFDEPAARRVLLWCGATYVAGAIVDVGFVSRRFGRDDVAGEHGLPGGRSSRDDDLGLDDF